MTELARARSTTPAGAPASEVAIDVDHLSHRFARPGGGDVHVLEDVSLTVRRGQFVAVVGPSGCGKTTLLNILSGLERAQQGRVVIGGHSPAAGSPDIGYLFARDALLPWRTVRDNAALAMELRGVPKRERLERATALLREVGLESFADSYPAQLSQGMRQRVAIARTLGPEPDIVLLDEPFSALDAQTKLLLQDTFTALWAQLNSTVVLITHDLSEAIGLADLVVLFSRSPGGIKRVFEIDLPRPRSMVSLQGDRDFHQLYEQLWSDLRTEVEQL